MNNSGGVPIKRKPAAVVPPHLANKNSSSIAVCNQVFGWIATHDMVLPARTRHARNDEERAEAKLRKQYEYTKGKITIRNRS